VSPGQRRAREHGVAQDHVGTAPFSVALGTEDVSEWEHALDSGVLWGDSPDGVDDVPTSGTGRGPHAGVDWRRHRGAPQSHTGERASSATLSGRDALTHCVDGGDQLRPGQHRDAGIVVHGCEPRPPEGEAGPVHVRATFHSDEPEPQPTKARRAGGMARAMHLASPPVGALPVEMADLEPLEGLSEQRQETGRHPCLHTAGEAREGAWWGRRSRGERRRQQQEVAVMAGVMVQQVLELEEQWEVRQLWALCQGVQTDWTPWPTSWSFPNMLWDITLARIAAERASFGKAWSPDTPVGVDTVRVPESRRVCLTA
jgi:hypothetical protein